VFNTYALLIEVLVIAFLALLAFERSRRWAVYGDRGKIDLILVGAVGVSVFVGALMFLGYRNTAAKLADPYQAANLASVPASGSLKRDTKLRAQREYLASGYTPMYDADGAQVRYEPTYLDTIARATILSDIARKTANHEVRLAMALLWMFTSLVTTAVGFASGRQEYRSLRANHDFRRVGNEKTFAEVDGLINLLRGACEDPALYSTLDLILTQPDHGRKAMLRELITEMRAKQAPADLIDAFICLTDDAVAEKAYTVIFKCERKVAPALA
jgi:hypothetical protein